jgi:NAD(P)-dependent dehydrogenase (short-subunit alcohol dehydrogenase family)
MKQKILITGINRGLGLAMTKIFLKQGHHVYAIIRRSSDELESLKKKYTEQLKLFDGNVTDEISIKHAVSLIKEDTDSIDMLINNSAVYLHTDKVPLEQADFADYLTTYHVNAIGPLKVIKHALPLIQEGKGKRIVNISSEAGSISAAWRKEEYGYCMSKAALNMGSRILQNYVKDDGINVLAIHPGWFSSDMGTAAAPITPEQAAKKVVKVLDLNYDIDGHMYYDLDGKEMQW